MSIFELTFNYRVNLQFYFSMLRNGLLDGVKEDELKY